MIAASPPAIDVDGLAVDIATPDGILAAVTDASFTVERGEIHGIVGESGCGKSITAKAIAGLLPRSASIRKGTIRVSGTPMEAASERVLRQFRGRHFSLVFQDPGSRLNPTMRIGRQVAHAAGMWGRSARSANAKGVVTRALRDAGFRGPEAASDMYPFQMSGGMQQRAMIAIALASGADLLIADEPTTALDVTVQAEIIDVIRRLREQRGLSVMYITHDLALLASIADRVTVMYAGRSIESASIRDVIDGPMHPYTQGLVASVPQAHSTWPLGSIEGTVPDMMGAQDAVGCPFEPRCPDAMDVCRTRTPERLSSQVRNGMVACHLYGPETGVRAERGAR